MIDPDHKQRLIILLSCGGTNQFRGVTTVERCGLHGGLGHSRLMLMPPVTAV